MHESVAHEGRFRLLIYAVIGIAVGTLILTASVKILFLGLGILAISVMSYLKPDYALNIMMASIVITAETIGEEVGGIPILEDIKVIKGVPPATISMLLVLFAIYFFKHSVIMKEKSVISYKYLIPYSLLLLVAFVNGLHNGSLSLDIKNDFYRFTYPVLCLYLCLNLMNNHKKNMNVIWVVYIACLVKSIILDINYIAGHGEQYDGNIIVTTDSAVLMAVGVMITFAFGLLVSVKELKWKKMIGLSLLPMIFTIVFSFRRAHWIGQVAALAVLFVWCSPQSRRRMSLVIPIGAVLAIGSYFIVTVITGYGEGRMDLSSRFKTIFDSNQHSNKHHYLETAITFQDVLKKPLLGIGLGGMHSPVPDSIIGWPDEEQPLHIVHNTFLLIWMKLGVCGLLFYLWVGAAFLRKLYHYRRHAVDKSHLPMVAGVGSGVGIWFVMFLTGPVPWYFHQTFLLALFAAYCINLIRIDEQNRQIYGPSAT